MADHPRLQILPPEVTERIAAGEVVERPASVIKELIENSLDAGAKAISVELYDGGLKLIRVADDGSGMTHEEASLALQRFSTSKIHTLADLDAVTTLGFRGEALASIAAVAHVELLTRATDEVEGTRVRATGIQIEVTPAASPAGTSVTVADLFYNTPARRKFLKAPMRESQLVRQVVVSYSLAYPGVAFRLVANGREAYVAPPAGLLERVGTALGRDIAAEMVGVAWEAADLRVWGLISTPNIGRKGRQGQFFFVNGRPVRAGLLAVMLERPYAGRLPPDRRPLAVLHIQLDPRLLDVNVHPRKEEVRFSQERSIYGAVARAVEEALAPYPRHEQAEFPGLEWPFGGVPLEPGVVRERSPEYVTGGLEPLAQLQNAYIVAIGGEGLVVVDQHAAHEQVLFERLLEPATRHELNPPLRLELTAREVEAAAPLLDALAELGIEVEPFAGSTLLVRSLPATLAHQEPRALVEALLEELPACRQLDPEAIRERLAAKAACTAAVKAGDILSIEQMRGLLRDLQAAWSPATCPHGRPTFVLVTTEELERRFMRR